MATKRTRLTEKTLREVRLRTQLSIVRNVPNMAFPGQISEKMRAGFGEKLASKIIDLVAGAEDVTDDAELALMGETIYGILPLSERKTGYHLLRIPSPVSSWECWCEVMCTNHLTFSICGRFVDTEKPYEHLAAFLRKLEEKMPFAYDETLGYLAAQMTLVGTGMRLRSWVHLGALVHFNYVHELNNAAEAAGILVETEEHEPPPPGSIYILFNRHTLGCSPEDTIRRFDHFMGQVVKQEMLARERLALDEPYLLLDRLIRAKTIFANTLMLCEGEMLDLLSDLRIGADVGAVKRLKVDPFADAWFETLRDSVFCVRMLDFIEDQVQLPPSVMESPQWRLEACRAEAARLFSKFDISKKYILRAIPE